MAAGFDVLGKLKVFLDDFLAVNAIVDVLDRGIGFAFVEFGGVTANGGIVGGDMTVEVR